MKFFVTFLLLGVCLVQSAPTTLLSTITPQQFGSNPPQISRYVGQSNYPGYYVYNYLQVDHGREIPVAVFADSTPGIPHFEPTYAYYGTPFYDYRYQLNQLFPGLVGGYQPPTLIPSGQPPYVPPQGPTFQPTTERPSYEDDGVEKLDEKLEPVMESDNNNAHREDDDDDDDDDSVTIDAI